jgi:parallel beta helix pectate lyase-like protein
MSRTSPRLTASLCTLLLPMAACQELNPEFCVDHPDDATCRGPGMTSGSGPDGGGASASCINDAACTVPTPVCDISLSRCVACTADEPSACRGATPTCGADDTCRACGGDADCASSTCLPDGSCAAPIEVLHAAPDGRPMASCMPADPCSLLRAIALIDGTKSTIHLAAGAYDLAETLALPGSIRIVGRGAVIHAFTVTGATLRLGQDAEIELDDLTIEGGGISSGGGGDGIACTSATLTAREVSIVNHAAMGIDAANCTLAVSHSQITGNHGLGVQVLGGTVTMTRSKVIGNQGGGVVIESPLQFDVENNLIAQNTGPQAQSGFAVFGVDAARPHVFAFNTVAQNLSASPEPGVGCFTAGSLGVVFANNIVFGNLSSSTASQVVTDNCKFAFSDIGPAAFAGTGTITGDPQFVDAAAGDFHLMVRSPARDAADPAATLAVDLDDVPRPQGAGRDMGAYENQ